MVMTLETSEKVHLPERERLLAAARDYLLATGTGRAVIEDELHEGVSVVLVLRQSEPLRVQAKV